MSLFEFEVGERVWDDLTGKVATIIGLEYIEGRRGLLDRSTAVGCVGYWVDNECVNGGRHPWEISKLSNQPKVERVNG